MLAFDRMAILFLALLLAGIAIAPANAQQNATNSTCINSLIDLEKSLLNKSSNVESLTRAFFPPNRPSPPVVEACYYVLPNTVADPENMEQCENATYRFRWSVSPIFLYMDPNLLESLSLYAVQIHILSAKMLLDPLCAGSELASGGFRSQEELLNQLTTLLRSYATRRSIVITEGVDEDLTGYAIYFNTSEMDYTIVNRRDDYTAAANILYISVVVLEVFCTVGLVVLLYSFLDQLCAISHNTRWSQTVYFVWACVIVAFVCSVAALMFNFVVTLGFRLAEANGLPARANLYYIAVVVAILVIIFDAVMAGLLTKIKGKQEFPVPHAVRFVCCVNLHCCHGNTHFLQCLAILSTLLATQLLAFHSVFLSLAFMASPVQAGASILFIGACIFCAISILTLFLAVLRKRPDHLKVTIKFVILRIITVGLFLFLLAFVVLFSYYFLRVTVFSGDAQSGGITNIAASVFPSILLAGLGWLAKRMFERYQKNPSPNEASSGSDEIGLADMGKRSSEFSVDVPEQVAHYT